MIRGLWDVFSLGLDELGERIAREGFEVTVARGRRWRQTAMLEADARSGGSHHGLLVVGGHSYGADNAVRFCRELETKGVNVDLLLLLDATSPPPIPGNVRRCVHYYEPTVFGVLLPFALAGNPVQLADPNARTELVNRRISENWIVAATDVVTHFTVDADQSVHQLCLGEIRRLKGRVETPTGSHVRRVQAED
ncbi:MAG: hypothetical protein PVI86_14930 [Phycisphaerae bacterium]